MNAKKKLIFTLQECELILFPNLELLLRNNYSKTFDIIPSFCETTKTYVGT